MGEAPALYEIFTNVLDVVDASAELVVRASVVYSDE
jgi:hypothetical protein